MSVSSYYSSLDLGSQSDSDQSWLDQLQWASENTITTDVRSESSRRTQVGSINVLDSDSDDGAGLSAVSNFEVLPRPSSPCHSGIECSKRSRERGPYNKREPERVRPPTGRVGVKRGSYSKRTNLESDRDRAAHWQYKN